ncbi:MAG: hypothetical protein Q7J86_00495, partial [Bacteroidota bacterium]|nr:hypothetical protein [Bacteroidota bacterium]
MKLIILAGIILAGNVFIGFAVYITNQKRIESEQLVQHTEDIQNTEKENRAAELILANKELVFQNE